MKNNIQYRERKEILKKVAKLHTKILNTTINSITAFMLSFIITYTKHKIENKHDDFIETWSICLVQLHTLKPMHTFCGKFIMWFLLKHKNFIDSTSEIEEDIVESESESPEEISMSEFRKDLWKIFFK